ncbi:MAG: Eco57I restriction-modification methylase domain-containing protein [Opitutales bacterium]|nr:Eco57I restriction-modification methylase domain-containing protein [Opitutales bacterium]
MNSTETSGNEAFLGRIFGQIYKPDILQCLANLSSDEVFTPPEVVNAMLDMLPSEIWQNPNLKFLDPACKTGVFLREITKRLIKGLEKKIPDLQKRIDHILRNMVYGIAITQLTSLVARRSLYCTKDASSKYSISAFEKPEGNVAFENLRHTWQNGKCVYCGASQAGYDRDESLEQHAYKFIHIKNPEEIFNMKFDVIIGNPPYQLATGTITKQATPIYNKFVIQAKKLDPTFLIMITPARWFSGGMGLDEFRDEMLNDEKIDIIHDFPNAQDCFPGVEIKGGVCFFLRNKNSKKQTCTIHTHINNEIISTSERPLKEKNIDIFIRHNNAIPILRKIQAKSEKFLSEQIEALGIFGFPTNFNEFKKEPFENSIKIYGNKFTGYISRDQITAGENLIKKYKVLLPEAIGTGGFDLPLKPIITDDNSCCTFTYVIIGSYNNINQAENLCSYLKTNFTRFLIGIKKITQHATRAVYQFVPMQDFSKPWTDEELYKKYGLSEEEIKFIEENIKPME